MIISMRIQTDERVQRLFTSINEGGFAITDDDQKAFVLSVMDAIKYYNKKKPAYSILYKAVQSYEDKKRTKASEPRKPIPMFCQKTGYDTKDQARTALKSIRKNNEIHSCQRKKTPIRSYECPNCGLFHLTSKPFK